MTMINNKSEIINKLFFNELKEIIISQAPYMTFFFDKYPNIFGYPPELNGGITIMVTGFEVGVLVLVIISIGILYLNFLRILKKNKQLLTQGTYRMQVSLYLV